MGEGERKLRLVVVEELGGPETLQPVAGGAVGVAELPAMGVLVTGRATRFESEKGAIEIDAPGEERRRVGDRRLAMAGPAFERRVGAQQGIAGERMVERLDAGLAPVDQFEIASLVLDVAALAGFMVGTGVEALPGGDALLDRRVTGEAELAVDAAIGAVALEAAVAAVEVGMGAAQLAGRDLAWCRPGREQGTENNGCGQDAP